MMCSKLATFTMLMAAAACGGGGGDGGDDDGTDIDAAVDAPVDAPLEKFSFFVTSLETMRTQSGSQDGFGGNLGGLAGADAICQTAAANVGFGGKTWRAYLSVYNNGSPLHAIDRIGTGPWYDRNQRLIANDIAGLLHTRPEGDAATINDLPDEFGVPGTQLGDTHDIMTATNSIGHFDGTSAQYSCQDWTSAVGPGSEEIVRLGHSWPAFSGQHWATAHRMRGCSPGVNLVQNGPGEGDCVGCGGGWGGIYCFALEP
jgi:hypothetical protein